MRIGVLSDTHQNIPYVQQSVGILRAQGIEKLVHLGDDYEDMEVVRQLDLPLLRVPGIFSSYYIGNAIPNRLIEEIEGWKVLLTHSPISHENDLLSDIAPEDIVKTEGIDLVLYGHTHIPKIEERDGVIWFNPGHLRIEDRKGFPASWGIIDLGKDRIRCGIVTLVDGRKLYAGQYGKRS